MSDLSCLLSVGILPSNVHSIQVHTIFLPFFLTKHDLDKINGFISDKRYDINKKLKFSVPFAFRIL